MKKRARISKLKSIRSPAQQKVHRQSIETAHNRLFTAELDLGDRATLWDVTDQLLKGIDPRIDAGIAPQKPRESAAAHIIMAAEYWSTRELETKESVAMTAVRNRWYPSKKSDSHVRAVAKKNKKKALELLRREGRDHVMQMADIHIEYRK